MATALERAWYAPRRALWLLWPLHALMRALVTLRRALYRCGLKRSEGIDAPVIVIGNITVGGAGKTPLVLAVVEYLRAQGWRPGIISRGYKATVTNFPHRVLAADDAARCGDEPLLLAQRSDVPVFIDPDRVRAARAARAAGCDIIVSDDGLQHYRLRRDIEIHVLDAVRQLGNGWLLPAGPLREPASRLREVDLRVGNGAAFPGIAEHAMHLQLDALHALHGEGRAALADWRGRRVHAVAGIGNPERFFQALRQAGLDVEAHSFADHHAFSAADLPWRDAPILMTEKDAVKCRAVIRDAPADNIWWLPVSAQLPEEFFQLLAERLRGVRKE